MCDTDYDYWYTSEDKREQRARKEHVCCACQDVIRAGDRYRATRLTSNNADSRFEFYKHCLRCAAMLDAIRKERPDAAIAWHLDCGEDWKDTIGDLPEEIAALAFLTPDAAQQRLAQKGKD
jgi:hypothetical protein